MIIDRMPLAGRAAYLGDGDSINLAAAADQSGRTDEILEGQSYEIAGLSLYLEGDDLLALYARDDKPLIQVAVIKEMFPGLFADPNAHRVHTVAGFEDLRRGTGRACGRWRSTASRPWWRRAPGNRAGGRQSTVCRTRSRCRMPPGTWRFRG